MQLQLLHCLCDTSPVEGGNLPTCQLVFAQLELCNWNTVKTLLAGEKPEKRINNTKMGCPFKRGVRL